MAGISATLAADDEIFGPNPKLPAVDKAWIPTVQVATATGWKAGEGPKAGPGLKSSAFATGLDHPRWLLTLPNGDVLVAESNAPARPDENNSIKGWFMSYFMNKAGAGVPSANRITILRDGDGDGVAELKSPFLTGLNSPFGMALIGSDLYVANTDAIVKFPYKSGDVKIEAQGVKVADLPAGPRNHHWTKNIIASPDGKKLYATVGSNSNVAENGMEEETNRAAILEVNLADGKTRVFASGLRNPNGLDFKPDSEELWTTVNERDELGDNLVPDYMTSVKDGAFYGWPYSYFGNNVDDRVKPANPELVAKAIIPDYALGAHTASLGLAFARGDALGSAFSSGVFVGQHGSWNRSVPSGYKVIFVPFAAGKPSGKPVDVLTGFLTADGKASGRPVGVAFDKSGSLLVADDVGNAIWRVTSDKATDRQASN